MTNHEHLTDDEKMIAHINRTLNRLSSERIRKVMIAADTYLSIEAEERERAQQREGIKSI